MSNLPSRPSLASLRKQTKSLLKSVRANNSDALATIAELHPKPGSFATLGDAQLVIARQYGHQDWSDLCEAVQTSLDAAQSTQDQASLFADLACLRYNDDDIQRRERATRLFDEVHDLTSSDVYAAAAAFDIEALQRLIDADPDCVNRPGGPRKWSSLMYITYSRVPESPPKRDAVVAAHLLLDAGADPNFYISGTTSIGGWRWYALTGAIGEGEAGPIQEPPHAKARELAEMLLAAGADPNDSQGLYNSMFTQSNEWIELLIAHGLTSKAIVDREGDLLVTTLNYQLSSAVQRGFTDRVALLLEHGADATGQDEWYGSSQHIDCAVEGGHGDIVDLLVAHGATAPDLSSQDRYRIAVTRGDEAEARGLMETDSDLRRQPDMLVSAAHNGRIDVVRLLLDLGADPNELAGNGRGALHEAAWFGHLDVVHLLLDRGASSEVRDNRHDGTAVGWANVAGRLDMRDILLEHSVDVFDLVRFGKAERLKIVLQADPALAHATRKDGKAPIHFVDTNGIDGSTILDLLIESGADFNAKTDDGETALTAAVRSDNEALADLLRDRDAEE